MGGARTRRPRAGAACGLGHRRVPGHLQQRPHPACAGARRRGDRRLPRVRQRPQRGLGTDRLLPRPAGAGAVDRHGLLVVAGGAARGLHEPAQRRVTPGAGGRREPDVRAAGHGGADQGAHARTRRSLQDLRRVRRRFLARRGLRHAGAQAPGRCAGRRRPGARGDPRHGGEPGRPQRRPDGAQRAGARGGDPRRARRCEARAGRHRLRRSARYRHIARRPDRSARAGRSTRCRAQCAGTAADRLGEDQHRPPRIGGRHRRRHQDRARAAARTPPETPALHATEPAHRMGRPPGACGGRRLSVAARRAAAARRHQLVRLLRHQRARDRRGGTGGRRIRGGGGSTAACLAAVGTHTPGAARTRAADGRRAWAIRGLARGHRFQRGHRPVPFHRAAGTCRGHGGERVRSIARVRPRRGTCGADRRQCAARPATRAGVHVHRPGLAVPWHGRTAVHDLAGLPRADRRVRNHPRRRCPGPHAEDGVVRRPQRKSTGRLGHPRDRLDAAGALRGRILGHSALALLGHRAGRSDRALGRRVHRGLCGRRVPARRRPAPDRRTWQADAGAAARRLNGGAVRTGRRGGPRRHALRQAPRDRRVQRARQCGRLGRHRRGRHPAGRLCDTPCARPASVRVARRAFGSCRTRTRCDAGLCSARGDALAPAAGGLEPDRRPARLRHAGFDLLAPPPARTGALRRRHRLAARPGLPRVSRSRPAPDVGGAGAAHTARERYPPQRLVAPWQGRLARADAEPRRAVRARGAHRLGRRGRHAHTAPRRAADLPFRAPFLLDRRLAAAHHAARDPGRAPARRHAPRHRRADLRSRARARPPCLARRAPRARHGAGGRAGVPRDGAGLRGAGLRQRRSPCRRLRGACAAGAGRGRTCRAIALFAERCGGLNLRDPQPCCRRCGRVGPPRERPTSRSRGRITRADQPRSLRPGSALRHPLPAPRCARHHARPGLAKPEVGPAQRRRLARATRARCGTCGRSSRLGAPRAARRRAAGGRSRAAR